MRRTILKYIFLIGILAGVSLGRITFAQDVVFQAHVDKARLSFEDVVVLTFTLSGGNIDLNVTPEIPELKDDFDVLRGPNRSTSISIVNGRQSSLLTLQYMLSPKKTGTLTIGPATLTHNKQTYTTQPITIEVFQGAPPQSSSETQDSGAQQEESPEVFVRTEVDKSTAYIGEQITISYLLYTRVNISQYNFAQQPTFTGFWAKELQVPNPPTLEYQTLNGVRYGVALMKKVALFPTASGDVTIEPLVMTFGVRTQSRTRDPFGNFFNDPFDDFFGRTQELIRKTQPLDLKILPLPEENRPENFNGDVGRFTMSVDVDATQVTQNDAITLTVKIQGIGNIETVKEPRVVLPDSFKRYDPEIKEDLYTMQEPVQGEKVFTSVIIPSEAGEFQIEPVQFSYFDPERKAYQTLRSESITVTIQPSAQTDEPATRRIASKEDIKVLEQDIRFINTSVTHLVDQSRYVYQRSVFAWLLAIPLIMLPLVIGYTWYRSKYQSNERHMRGKRARRLSRQRFSEASTLLKQGEDKAFYAAISQALHQYLGDKLHQPPARITTDVIGQTLQQYGLDDDSINELKACLEHCDFARFAPVGSSEAEMADTLRKAESLVDKIEKLRIQPDAAGIKNLLIVCVLSAISCVSWHVRATEEAAADAFFLEGNALYEMEQYAEAALRYQAIIDTGLQNGYVYYNLGNALLKQQRLGEAILAYERAQRLLPRDDAVVFNLEYAQALTVDKMEQWDSGFVARMLAAVREAFTINEVSLAFVISYVLVMLLLMAFILTSRTWKVRILRIGLLPVLVLFLSGCMLVLQLLSLNAVDEAIVLAPSVEARTGPGDSYSAVFEIHEGAKIRIQRQKQEWFEIKLPNKVIGWVMEKDIERII
jgi:tetratricopeptide (TPR) repeat protein